jgi:branched-chain amino acid transport system substrate-binding protein
MDQDNARSISRRTLLRSVLGGAGAVTIASVLAACGGAPSASNAPAGGGAPQTAAPAAIAQGSGTLKIGLLSGFSGPYAAFGPDMANCVTLFLEQHNGLVGGLKATVVQEDEGATPQEALLKARKLVEQDRVDVLTGIVSSANALAVRDLLDSAKVPTLITNAGADDLTGSKRSQYIVRVSFSSWQAGAPTGRWAVQQGYKKVVALAPDYAAGYEQLGGFEDTFTHAGGTLVEKIFPPLGNSDYAPFLGKIKSSNPDAVWGFFAGADQIKFVQQYSQFVGDSVPLIGNILSRNAADAIGKTMLVVKMGATPWEVTLDNPVNNAFVESFRSRFNKYPDFGQYQYDAMMLLDKVLTDLKGNTDKDQLARALNSVTSFQSIRGEVQVDPESHGLIQSYYHTIPVESGDSVTLKVVGTLGLFAPSKQLS